MSMPVQKPGKSKQSYGTPPVLIAAVCGRLQSHFTLDLAASADNAICAQYFTADADGGALCQPWAQSANGWAWLNPPFADLEPWVRKAREEAALGLSLVMLVPSSVGSLWWKRHVEPYAYIWHLCPRVTFVGETTPFPKDCSILIYTPLRLVGAETWQWTKL